MSTSLHVPAYGSRLEHAVIRALVAHLDARGFKPLEFSDGEEVTPTPTLPAVLDTVFAVDDGWLCFHSPAGAHSVRLVCGNGDPFMDFICDWNYSHGDADGFNATMEAFFTVLESAPLALVQS